MHVALHAVDPARAHDIEQFLRHTGYGITATLSDPQHLVDIAVNRAGIVILDASYLTVDEVLGLLKQIKGTPGWNPWTVLLVTDATIEAFIEVPVEKLVRSDEDVFPDTLAAALGPDHMPFNRHRTRH
jgi:hypothetical protein